MIELHAFDDPRAQAGALAKAVSGALGASLTAPGTRATLAVSGGTSPRPLFEALALEPLEWPRVNVTLVDDRWVPETDNASNARLVRETLLTQAAAAARFAPLVDVSVSLDARVAALNADPLSYALPNVAVLGMGEDGHTASLFADAPPAEWAHGLQTADRYVAMHPGAAPHARVSFSMSALKGIERLFLLISGERKLDVLKAAASAPQENAISKLANDKGVRLDVYWSAK